jgi:SEC-C motif
VKTGRNALCPCGSGRKYKKCCLATRDRNAGQPPRTPLPEEVQKAFVAMQQSEAARIQKYGYVRPPITEKFQGQQFVAVGSRLLFDAKWKTFHDFLFTYLGAVFEKEWFAAELRQPLETRHPLMQWYETLHEFDAARRTPAEKGQVLRIDEPPAEVSALLSFAYDLYTLENYSLLPKRLVKRLQHKDQFQGARYETYVAAAFVRAGFVVTPEDETDVTSSHCEFTAVHAATGEAYSVEAKTRHRAGYLGQPGAPTPLQEIQGDARRLLISALRKEANHDRVVFIDVNVPPADSSIFVTEWFDKIASQMKELEEEPHGDPFPPAFVFLTNFPYHFVGEGPLHGATVRFTGLNVPEFRAGHTDAALIPGKFPAMFSLYDSVLRHTAVPHELS